MSSGRRRRERRGERQAPLRGPRAPGDSIARRGEEADRAWQQARARWLDERSPLHGLWHGDRGATCLRPDFVECAAEFLETDPMFHGSGYLKEAVLRCLRRAALDEPTADRFREVLLDAVQRRGGREFTRYCSLAALLGNEAFVARLGAAALSPDGAVRSRARVMRGWIARHGVSPAAREAARVM